MITIDYKDRSPLYEQITTKIENLVALGVLKQDEKLPSVRKLAIDLSINPNTIQKAYTALETKGLIYTVKGVGNFVSTSENLAKDNKLFEIYEEIYKKIVEARTFGLTDKLLYDWFENFKGGK